MNVRERLRRRAELSDIVIAGVLFTVCEIEVIFDLVDAHAHVGSVVLNCAVISAMTIPLVWLRRFPLVVTCLAMACITISGVTLRDFSQVNSIVFVVVVVSYIVAAHEPRSRALVGFVICLVMFCAVSLIDPTGRGSWTLGIGIIVASSLTGRIVSARRVLTTNLKRQADRTRAEREGRELLALAEERTRIARELQELVAHSVSTMVVQSTAAQLLLEGDAAGADAAMAVIEETGRGALIEMRRILGVLSRVEEVADLSPQPGIGQIHALVERARQSERDVTLHVEGTPGPLPASVDLGTYRVLEEVLDSTGRDSRADLRVDVVVRFEESEVLLSIATSDLSLVRQSIVAIEERVALCGGALTFRAEDDRESLIVRLPRTFDGGLA